mgnify:CR=1 FL=1
MNRKQFMEELRQLLTGISEEERVEALQYYEDYFDDAGAENEQQVRIGYSAEGCLNYMSESGTGK